MFGSWTITTTLREEVCLVPRLGTATAPAKAKPIEPSAAFHCVDHWFPDDLTSQGVLSQIVLSLEPHLTLRGAGSISWLRARVADALRSGRLVAYAVDRPLALSGGGAAPVAPEKPADKPPPKEEDTTWIGIQLSDDSGAPVAFKRYRIELPDGSKREGMLDEKGMARFDGIDPGNCEVTFPDFDASDWKAA
jgi:hypothetical protein